VPPCKAYARGGEAPAATLPLEPKRRWVAIKAGALVSTIDGGRIWRDRVTGGSKDTHELVSAWSASWRPADSSRRRKRPDRRRAPASARRISRSRSAHLFFQLVARRYERGSLLISTNQMGAISVAH
jgi:hypothetical protein